MRKLLQTVFNRVVIVALLVLIQIGLLVWEIIRFSERIAYISIAMKLISLIVVFLIVYKKSNPAVKLAWIVPIMAFPVLGGFMYLLLGHLFAPSKIKANLTKTDENVWKSIKSDKQILEELKTIDSDIYSQCKYITEYAPGCVYKNTNSIYFNDAEEYLANLIDDIKSAQKFIFVEYFIISLGTMWDEVYDALLSKVNEGVEVRLIYDDFGSAKGLPKNYYETLNKKGIKCVSFNRLVPFASVVLNYRDHRKNVVIDGRVAYSGGINLADEYVNRINKFGHWKDAGLKIEGDAVWSMTVLFLQMWNYVKNEDADFGIYRGKDIPKYLNSGYVLPFGDTPLDDELMSENTYLNMIDFAKEYIWIYTPYLIIDDLLMGALERAAKRGVDVRIVTPGIPDKKMVFYMTRCSYPRLIDAGAHIYEYSPGFIHAKCTLVDDKLAMVGTVNYDYRSLYHHFECGILMYKTPAIDSLKSDMENTFIISEEINRADVSGVKIHANVFGPLLHLFAPLL